MARWLVGLEVALAVAAFGGTIGLLSGAIPMAGAFEDVPFGSAALAGLSLTIVNGVLPTVAVVAELRRLSWAGRAHVAVGAALIGWIVVQIAIIGLTSWLQPFMFSWGAAILALALVDRRRASF